MTGNPEVISSPVGLVLTNALVLTALANFRVVGKFAYNEELDQQLDAGPAAQHTSFSQPSLISDGLLLFLHTRRALVSNTVGNYFDSVAK